MVDCECGNLNLCDWSDNKAQEIIQGDVNITYNQSKNDLSYIADIAMRRERVGGVDTIPFSAQALAVMGQYAMIVYVDGVDDHNRMVVMDISTQKIISVQDDFLPRGYHWNSACFHSRKNAPNTYYVVGKNGSICTVAEVIVFERGIPHHISFTSSTTSLSIGGITWDNDSDIVIGHSAGAFYSLNILTTGLTGDLLFDGGNIIEAEQNWLYPGYTTHSQECEYHDGVLYSIYSHPNTVFKFSLNGQFLGAESLPFATKGHPVGELEAIAWSEMFQTNICLSQGRVSDDYITKTGEGDNAYLWGRSFIWSWGGAAVDNWRTEYSTNAGDPSNVQVGSYKDIYAVATEPPVISSLTDYSAYDCRHDGTPDHPFNFLIDALYMAEMTERDSSRPECRLRVKGDFNSYEQGSYNGKSGDGIVVHGNLKIIMKQPENGNTILPRFSVANSASVDFSIDPIDRTTAAACSVERLLCSRNSRVSLYGHCPEIHVSAGAVFTGNYLGDTEIHVGSCGIAHIGGTDTEILPASERAENGLVMIDNEVSGQSAFEVVANNINIYGVITDGA